MALEIFVAVTATLAPKDLECAISNILFVLNASLRSSLSIAVLYALSLAQVLTHLFSLARKPPKDFYYLLKYHAIDMLKNLLYLEMLYL